MNNSEHDSNELKDISHTIDRLVSQKYQNVRDFALLKKIFKDLSLGYEQSNISNQQYELLKSTLNPEMNQKILQRKEQEEMKLKKYLKIFRMSRIAFYHNLNLVIETADIVSSKIVGKHLQNWRDNQILLGNEQQSNNPEVLNKIQNCCEHLANVLWTTRKQLKMVPMYHKRLNYYELNLPALFKDMLESVENLLVCLVKNTVIIENQPPQVLLSNETFSTNIRLLVGDALNIKKMKPLVKVSIVSEDQAQNFEKLVEKTDLKCGKLKNSSGKIKFDNKSSKLVANFDALKIKKKDFDKNIRNKIKNSEGDVTDVKFGLLFQCKLTIGDGGLETYIKALSSPIVMKVNGSQKLLLNETILWDNKFPVIDRQPFNNEEFFLNIIRNIILKYKVCLLTEKKLPVPKQLPNDDNFTEDMGIYSLSKALRENDAGNYDLWEHKLIFFEWIYGVVNLVKNHLCEPWNENYIIGFIDIKSAKELLLQCEPGTFLLRFSDNQDAGLVIDYCALRKNNKKRVMHCEPLTSKELEFCSLTDRVLNAVDLKMLYQKTLPHINKEDAFGKFSSHKKEQNAELDPMETEAPLINLSEIQFKSAIDSSIPTSSSVHTSTPIIKRLKRTPYKFSCFLSEFNATQIKT